MTHVMTLQELAAWEDRLDRLVRAAAAGSLEDRDRTLLETGVYADYAAVFRSYVDLLDDEDAGPEALKRATALVWLSGMEPAPLTGLAELPEQSVSAVRRALEERTRRGELDDELLWMLPWYYGIADFALVGAEAVPHLEAMLVEADFQAWRRAPPALARLAGRGQLGRYWLSVIGGA